MSTHARTRAHARSRARTLAHTHRPDKLTLNFRSHSGILDVAALVLGRLELVYPDAIDKLPRDRGLCKGPRPMLLALRRTEELGTVLGTSDGGSALAVDFFNA